MKKIFKASVVLFGFLMAAAFPAFYFRSDIRSLALEVGKLELPDETRENSGYPSGNQKQNVSENEFNGINLAVPFSSQAPFGDWNLPYLDACEETSALLVDRFWKNEELTPEIVKNEILKMVDWENEHLGFYKNTTAEETAQLIKGYFGYKKVEVVYDISPGDIKTELIAGRPIIIPIVGRMVDNPFYRQPGPAYHMLVVKGMTKDGKIITNDVGTKRGHNYVYDGNIFYDSIHDAPVGGEKMTETEFEKEVKKGKKVMIVVYPN